jgi:hypothetical protein
MPLIESRLRGHDHLVAVQLAIRLHHAGPSLDRLSRAGFARMFVARKRLKREPMSRIFTAIAGLAVLIALSATDFPN